MTEALVPLDLDIQLAIPGIELSPISLTITDPDLAYEDWERLLRAAQGLHSAAKFWIGDALNFGEAVYGERYAQFADALGKNPGTLENWASVCRRVSRSRRRDSLSFSHHVEVARLEPEEQVEWLEAAVVNGWSVDIFRQTVREAIPPKPRGEQPDWSDSRQPEQPEILSLEQVESAEKLAQETLKLTLPSGHPLWENQAKALAQDTLSLAKTAKVTLREAVVRAVEQAQPYGEIGVWIPHATWQELVALIEEEGGTP